MNGCIILDTPIAVDFWQIRQKPELKIFFLSHMHSDHTKGLSASWRRIIYCSPVTAKLAAAKLRVPASLLKPLEVGESHIIPIDETGQETMTVSLIDANHCPGAVMFLFEGYFGRILYTGDFRYQPSMITESILSSCGAVDRLFLDNTYNNANCVLPSRAECTKQIIDVIKQYPAYEIVIGTHKLGKEELLVDIALAFKMKIVVTPDRLRTLKILEMPDVFTTDSSESRIRAVPNHLVTRKNVAKWQEGAPTIAIIPTALYTSLEAQPFAGHPDIHVVPYSDHSSYAELMEFVSCVKPKAITPVVEDSRMVMGCNDMSNFDCFLSKNGGPVESSSTITIPESVLSYMKSGSISTSHALAQICMRGNNVRTKSRKVKGSQGRKRSLKEGQKGVVFDEGGDENVEDEMERRKRCEEQTRLLSNSGSDEDVGKYQVSSDTANHKTCSEIPEMCNQRETSEHQQRSEIAENSTSIDTTIKESNEEIENISLLKSCNTSRSLPNWCESLTPPSTKDSSKKKTEVMVLKSSIKSPPSGSGSSKLPAKRKVDVVDEISKPPAKRKMDVLTMLIMSASKRRALKDSAQEVIEVVDEIPCEARKLSDECLNEQVFDENTQFPKSRDSTQNRDSERAVIQDKDTNKSQVSETVNKRLTVDEDSSCRNESSLSPICKEVAVPNKDSDKINERHVTATPECRNKINQSGLLKLPCSVRKRRKNKRPIDVTKVFEQFMK